MEAMTPLTAERLAELLREAEKAHGTYEKQELGGVRDEDWPAWYAEFIVDRLREASEESGA